MLIIVSTNLFAQPTIIFTPSDGVTLTREDVDKTLAEYGLTRDALTQDNRFHAVIEIATKTAFDGAFGFCEVLLSVISYSLTEIGNRTFTGCYSLNSVLLPNVEKLGDYSFHGCPNLTSISFEKVTSIGEATFYYCSRLKSVNIPNITTIPRGAFNLCVGLTSVSFEKVTDIKRTAFKQCEYLTEISFPNVVNIDTNAFALNYRLVFASLGNGFDKETMIEIFNKTELPPNANYNAFELTKTENIDLCMGEYVLPQNYANDWNEYTWKSINESERCEVGIKDNSIAKHFSVLPNPVSANTIASFGLLKSENITLEVCDILGNVFYTISNFYDIGEHSVMLDTKDLSMGSYVCRLLSSNGEQIGTTNFIKLK